MNLESFLSLLFHPLLFSLYWCLDMQWMKVRDFGYYKISPELLHKLIPSPNFIIRLQLAFQKYPFSIISPSSSNF